MIVDFDKAKIMRDIEAHVPAEKKHLFMRLVSDLEKCAKTLDADGCLKIANKIKEICQ